VGSPSSSVNRVLTDFADRGWIRLTGRNVVILDADALASTTSHRDATMPRPRLCWPRAAGRGFWASPRVLAVVATPIGMRVLVARFFRHLISQNVQAFWAALDRGEFITDAAEAVGTYRKQGARWVVASGRAEPAGAY
jgi:Crp-like helix-turn-helix domain